MTNVALATEDELSEAVGLRLLTDAGLAPGLRFRKAGSGYLRTNLSKWADMVENGFPVVVLTDLDTINCPATLVRSWFGRRQQPSKLLLRVAVREVESWLLADHSAMQSLFAKKGRLPTAPDDVQDPKAMMLSLAQRAPRRVREDLVVERGAVARQGLGYNARLAQLVREKWDPIEASSRSDSLRRTRERLAELGKRLHTV